MEVGETVDLKRDCEVVQIPSGNTAVLPQGASVSMALALGGSFTVRDEMGRMFRISQDNADALGMVVEAGASEESEASEGPAGEEQIWDALKTVFDPEIPVNIVDLGLIYDMSIEAGDGGGSAVLVKMTLTAPGCGMGPVIAGDAQSRIESLSGVERALVEIVWDPPWHQSMISADGRRVLGLE